MRNKTHKICSICKELLPRDEFYLKVRVPKDKWKLPSDSKAYPRAECKNCGFKINNKKYYLNLEESREKQKLYKREWRKSETYKKYFESSREKRLKYCREYYASHKK